MRANASELVYQPCPQGVKQPTECTIGTGSKELDKMLIDRYFRDLIIDVIMEVRAADNRRNARWPLRLKDTIAGNILIAPNDLRGLTIMTTHEY